MLTYVLDCQHMTTTSERTSERAERARAEQTPTTACDARTASPAAPAHAAALSCKVDGMLRVWEGCWEAVLLVVALVAAAAAGVLGVHVAVLGALERCHRCLHLHAVEKSL